MNSIINLFSIKTILFNINIGSGYSMSYIEAIGTIFGLINIWLASKEKYINFYFGLINVVLFGVIFFQIQLYANLLLQIFFFAMNLYGLYSWRNHTDNSSQLKIHWLNSKQQIIITLLAILMIILMSNYINQIFQVLTNLSFNLIHLFNSNNLSYAPVIENDAHPYIDSTIMILSIIAMILMTRKVAENWIIWCIINILSIYVYASQQVYLMSFEYIILLIIAIQGSISWIKQANNNKPNN